MGTDGVIPQSAALAEASPDSVSELYNKDPEAFSKQDLDSIIADLRKARERFAAAEASGVKPTKRSPKLAPQAAASSSQLDF